MTHSRPDHAIEGLQKYFLLGMLILLIVTLFSFIAPFAATLFMAAVIVASVYPVHKKIKAKTNWGKTASAFLTLLLIIVVFLVPLTLVSMAIVGQAADAYYGIRSVLSTMIVPEEYQLSTIIENYPWLERFIPETLRNTAWSVQEVFGVAGDFVKTISNFLVQQTATILNSLFIFVLQLVIFLLGLFYLLRDGEGTMDYVKSLLPLSSAHRNQLWTKIYDLMRSIVYGIFGAAVAQGLILGIGLSLVGVENAAFWGAIGALLSPIPYVGVALVWIPIVVTLFFQQSVFVALFFLFWCLALVANIDNIVKPYLIGMGAALHPFGVMLVIFGGILAFGFKGLIFGPLILMMTLAFLHIYELEYQDVLKK